MLLLDTLLIYILNILINHGIWTLSNWDLQIFQARYLQKIVKILNNERSKTYSFRRILYVWLYQICDWSMFTLSEASMTKYFEKKWKIIQLFHKLAIFRWWHLTYMKHLFDAFVYTSFLTHPLDTIFMCRCSKT